MRPTRTLLAGLVAAVTLVAPAGPAFATASAAPVARPLAKPVVTPAQAKAIVRSWQVTMDRANGTLDVGLVAVIEGGSQRTVDTSGFRLSRLLGFGGYPPATFAGLRVYVPRQMTYPAHFLALVKLTYPNNPTLRSRWSAYLFERHSHADHWRLTAAPLVHSLPAFDFDKEGYLPKLVPGSLAVRPTALTTSWQAAENTAGHGGTPASPWAVNSLWREFVLIGAGAAQTYTVQASSTHLPPACFASHVGAVCVVSSQLDAVEALSDFFIQGKSFIPITDTQSQYDWGGVAQGHYSSLHSVALREAVIVVPRTKPGAQLQLVGLRYGPLSGSGVLSPP